MDVVRLHHHSSVSAKIFPIPRISRFASISRCWATSGSSSTANNKNEEGPIKDLSQQGSANAPIPRHEQGIPPRKLSLYEYIKILVGTVGRG